MSTLLCFGLGYSAEHFVGMFDDGFERIIGTVRGVERAAVLNARFAGRFKALPFDGSSPTPALGGAIAEADLALISIPQTETGDPVLAAFGQALLRARRLRAIVYLSTIGVYGDHGGAWVDEETPPPLSFSASPASTGPDATRSLRSRPEPRGVSSSPARSSIVFTSPISPRRSTRRLRARPRGSSTSSMTSRRRRASRSCSPHSFLAARRRRKFPSPRPGRACHRWR
jgi:hypothetical protein